MPTCPPPPGMTIRRRVFIADNGFESNWVGDAPLLIMPKSDLMESTNLHSESALMVRFRGVFHGLPETIVSTSETVIYTGRLTINLNSR